jgi:hypothetical protein
MTIDKKRKHAIREAARANGRSYLAELQAQRKAKAALGQPSTPTPALTQALCRFIREGFTFEEACKRTHLPQQTFYAWFERGEDEWEDDCDTPHADFARDVRKARAEFAIELHNIVCQGGRGWRVAARLLEKRFPEHYALGAAREQAQRLRAQRDVERAVRRGQPLTADWFELWFDALGPADVEHFTRLSGAPTARPIEA